MKQVNTLLALALLATPSLASANTITDARGDLGDDAYEVRVQAEADLGQPRVRTSPGFVRVWFPGMNSVSIDRDGDGSAIRFVRIRPGYEDTAVTIIRLGDMRRVDPDEVRITREGAVARIRIPRAVLPEIAPPAPAPVAETATVEETTDDAAEAAEEPPAEAAVATETETETEEAAAPPLALTRQSDAQPLPVGDGPSTTVILLVLTLLLGGGYFALRAVQKKIGKAGPRRDIEVIAQKRIGGKHQLLVVRALGEDHLLAVHAGRTEKIASMPAPSAGEAGDGESEENDLLPFLRLGAGEETDAQTLHRAVTRKAAARKNVEERPRFGAELMKLVGDRGRSDSVSLSGGVAAPSEAVAGLLRLREKLGR